MARQRCGPRQNCSAPCPITYGYLSAQAGRWLATPATTRTTAQGISDAFRDAEQCSTAVDNWLSGRMSFDDAFLPWHRERDRKILPTYEFTTQLATLEPPPPEMQQLLGAIYGNQAAMDDFVSVNAGTLSPEVFFSPEHIARTFQAAAVSG